MFKSKTPLSGVNKTCQNCNIKFTIEPEDFEFYKKVDVPAPTFCPGCRMIRRFNWRNERKLFKKTDDLTKKEIFSIFSSKADVKIYESDFWYSDKWDPMEYGQEYNFNKPFFKQLEELMKKVPWPSRAVEGLVNSDYCMNASFLKNCYLIARGFHSEDSSYGVILSYSKDSYDNYRIIKSELCYEGFALENCYKTFFSSHCVDCQEVYFSKNLVNCQNCFGCTNLKHKKYYIFNEQYAKKEYEEKIKEFNLGSYQSTIDLDKKTKELHLKYPNKFIHGSKNVNVVGDDIYNSKNIKDSYSIKDGEDLRYCQFLDFENTQDCYDYSVLGINTRLIYESLGCGRGLNNVKFSFHCFPDCRELEYCLNCGSSSNLFACVGLRHKQYCILNKQYTKKEYEELVPKIKDHMNNMPYTDKKGRIYKYGEFFPPELSPFGYNETIANEYFPLTKEEAIEQGYNWYDKPKSEYKPTIKASNLPDNIKDVDDSILKEVIECDSSNCAGSNVFRIIPQELKFYKKMNLPLPHLCPDCRHRERIKQRNPLKLWKRQCMKEGCSNEFQTTYAPERKEIVYCERCYNREVG